ncbi:MAG: oligosaccharide flippase family protein [Brachymonas sp.]|nr:oligosaccharide flippase family protein [Brachymonas sp.]
MLAAIKAGGASGLLRAVATLLMGGALAQVIPLLLGPVLTRLYTPDAFGVFTSFSTVVATVAVVACARYEFALPLARDAGEARALFTLCLGVCAALALLAVLLAAVLHATGHLPLPKLLPLAVAAAGLLQLLVMWATRTQAFRALAISRVLQYGGAAVLQVLLGGWLWRRAQQPAGADAAWGLVLAQVCAVALALLPLLPTVPSLQWRSAWQGRQSAAALGEASDATAAQAASGSGLVADAAHVDAASLRQVAWRYRDFPLLNTPHAFLGALQDAAAVAILVAYSGHAAAGFWGLALRYLKAPATLVGSAVSQALYPRLAQATPDVARQTVRQVMAVLGVLALGLMGVLMLAGPWLFEQVFGPGWREAGHLARALAPYIAAHFVAAPLAVVTMAWQAQRWALRWAVVGQLAFVAALALGLRQGGLLAGAWAVSAAMLLYFGIYFWRLACWRDIPAPQSAGAAAEQGREAQS